MIDNWLHRKIESADDLAQAFTDRHAERLAGFLRDIIIAARAKRMGPGALEHAGQHSPGWSQQTINRLAALTAMPEGVITNPETPLGVFWLIIQNTTPGETPDMLRRAQAEGWNIPKCKEELGLMEQRDPPIIAPTEAEAVSWQMVTGSNGERSLRVLLDIPGDGFPQDNPGAVKVKVWQ